MKFVAGSVFKPGQTGYYATPENPFIVFGELEDDGMLWVVMTRPGAVMGIHPDNMGQAFFTGDTPERERGPWSPVENGAT